VPRGTLHELRLRLRRLVPPRYRHRLTRVVLRGAAVALRGREVHCPCCGGDLRRFLTYPTALCPRCGSYERQRLLCLYLDSHPRLLTSASTVLHVAPEDCIRDRILRSRPRKYLSIDLDYPEAMRQMDLTRLDLPDASYDLVFVSHVLDAVADERAAIAELHRVLAPGGAAIVQAPSHQRAVDEPRLVAALTSAGFAVNVESVPEQADETATARLGLLPDERILLSRKI
jgi:SAM-dependent methyltransferase